MAPSTHIKIWGPLHDFYRSPDKAAALSGHGGYPLTVDSVMLVALSLVMVPIPAQPLPAWVSIGFIATPINNERRKAMLNQNQTPKLKPIKVFKRYPIQVVVFRHQNTDGSFNHTVEHTRSYRKDDRWFNTTRCHREHCLTLAKLYIEAESFIADLEQKDYEIAKSKRDGKEVA